MTLKELYAQIGGSYDQAIRVLRIDRLLDKHIRKFTQSDVIEGLVAAGETMDAKQLFDCAHAAKGICGNLGLTKLADLSSDIAEEFRAGSERKMTDDEVREKIAKIDAIYTVTVDGINQYAAS